MTQQKLWGAGGAVVLLPEAEIWSQLGCLCCFEVLSYHQKQEEAENLLVVEWVPF